MICKRCNSSAEKGDLFCRKCGEELPGEETFQCDCGAEVRNEDRFCHHCGAMFSSGNCGNCNADLMPNAKFCHECGTKQDEESGSFSAALCSEPSNEAPVSNGLNEMPAEQPKIEVYDDYGNVRPFEEKQEPPKKPKYKMSGDGYYEP